MRHKDGHVGTVVRDDMSSLPYLVQWDDANKGADWCTAGSLTPLTSETTAPLPEVIINGVRYVPAPEQAEAKEEKREPKEGEIWRRKNSTALILIVDEGRNVVLRSACLGGCRTHTELTYHYEFAYPSLAAAIEAGETFK